MSGTATLETTGFAYVTDLVDALIEDHKMCGEAKSRFGAVLISETGTGAPFRLAYRSSVPSGAAADVFSMMRAGAQGWDGVALAADVETGQFCAEFFLVGDEVDNPTDESELVGAAYRKVEAALTALD
jgi:hypothetical protein